MGVKHQGTTQMGNKRGFFQYEFHVLNLLSKLNLVYQCQNFNPAKNKHTAHNVNWNTVQKEG